MNESAVTFSVTCFDAPPEPERLAEAIHIACDTGDVEQVLFFVFGGGQNTVDAVRSLAASVIAPSISLIDLRTEYTDLTKSCAIQVVDGKIVSGLGKWYRHLFALRSMTQRATGKKLMHVSDNVQVPSSIYLQLSKMFEPGVVGVGASLEHEYLPGFLAAWNGSGAVLSSDFESGIIGGFDISAGLFASDALREAAFRVEPTAQYFDRELCFSLSRRGKLRLCHTATGIVTPRIQTLCAYLPTTAAIPAHFDDNFYLAHYPDVEVALESGRFSSAYHHYCEVGVGENRVFRWQSDFDESEYLTRYPDVLELIQCRVVPSAENHYVSFGRAEGRWAKARPT